MLQMLTLAQTTGQSGGGGMVSPPGPQFALTVWRPGGHGAGISTNQQLTILQTIIHDAVVAQQGQNLVNTCVLSGLTSTNAQIK